MDGSQVNTYIEYIWIYCRSIGGWIQLRFSTQARSFCPVCLRIQVKVHISQTRMWRSPPFRTILLNWAGKFELLSFDWLTDWLNAWQFEPLQAQEKMPRKKHASSWGCSCSGSVVVVVVVLWCSAVAVIYPSVYRSVYLFVLLFICLSVYLSASLKTKLFCETSSIFELDNIKNETILRDFLKFWAWQRQKRNNS